MDDPRASQPDPGQLVAFTARVHELLQGWRLLIATSHRAYANVLALQLQDPRPELPLLPQRLLAVCDSVEELHRHLPDDGADVLLFTEASLRDGSVLPWIGPWRQRPQPPRILLAMPRPLQPSLARAAWRDGVDALLCTDDYGTGELLRALEAMGRSERYRGPAYGALPQLDGPAADALSRRELEVLPLLAEGLTNRQIAQRLHIAEVTARDHVQRILQKLQVADRAAAAALAVRLGLAP